LRAILSEKSAPISLQLFEDRALRRARKLDRDAGGENALELHPSLFDRYARRTQESGGEQFPVSRNPPSCIGSERLSSNSESFASKTNCARNLECDSRGLTSTFKICTRTQYVGLAEQCQQTLAGPAMNFGADPALAALKA
jgi:hypothetical protein